MTHRRITAQQVFEAQELLSAASELPPLDHYPPTPQQVAEAERTIQQYEAQQIIVKVVTGQMPTHNHDGVFTRSWRLLQDGTVERTNSRSTYQPWIADEKIPQEILDAAASRNITIKAGRPQFLHGGAKRSL